MQLSFELGGRHFSTLSGSQRRRLRPTKEGTVSSQKYDTHVEQVPDFLCAQRLVTARRTAEALGARRLCAQPRHDLCEGVQNLCRTYISWLLMWDVALR